MEAPARVAEDERRVDQPDWQMKVPQREHTPTAGAPWCAGHIAPAVGRGSMGSGSKRADSSPAPER